MAEYAKYCQLKKLGRDSEPRDLTEAGTKIPDPSRTMLNQNIQVNNIFKWFLPTFTFNKHGLPIVAKVH